MPRIAVIGLGRFGMSLARQLGASRAEVLAIDSSQQLINEIRDEVDVAVRLDSTDELALKSQDLGSVDVCVVAIGENFEASLLTTVLARKFGIPRIICRAQTQVHAEIFRQIGAHEVIQPEVQAGEHLSHRLANEHIDNFIPLAEGYTLIELRPPAEFQGRPLRQMQLRSRYDVNLVAIKRLRKVEEDGVEREELETISVPKPDDVIGPNDVMVVVGSDKALAKLPQE